MERQFRQRVNLWASTGTQRANQKRSTKTLRSQQRAVVDDNPSEDSRYPSSDSSESSAGGVSLRACSTHASKEGTNDRATRTAPRPHSSDDAATHSQWLRQLSVTSDRNKSRIHTNRRPRRRIPLGARRKGGSKRSDEPKTPSTIQLLVQIRFRFHLLRWRMGGLEITAAKQRLTNLFQNRNNPGFRRTEDHIQNNLEIPPPHPGKMMTWMIHRPTLVTVSRRMKLVSTHDLGLGTGKRQYRHWLGCV
ncbi:hypothetical protein HD806DRAFT_381766 [Xylariaceae sp. AK1471]|nr:hypothetical protein HD806DRAFT_381766 [Xylariaceae sp. AK1471]